MRNNAVLVLEGGCYKSLKVLLAIPPNRLYLQQWWCTELGGITGYYCTQVFKSYWTDSNKMYTASPSKCLFFNWRKLTSIQFRYSLLTLLFNEYDKRTAWSHAVSNKHNVWKIDQFILKNRAFVVILLITDVLKTKTLINIEKKSHKYSYAQTVIYIGMWLMM